MSATNLGTLVTYNPWAVGPTAVLDDVAARFAELRIHHVPVVDTDRRIIGILSETDLLRARQMNRMVLVGSSGADTGEAPRVFARDVMVRDVFSIATTTNIREALALLLKQHIHMLPVVDGDRPPNRLDDCPRVAGCDRVLVHANVNGFVAHRIVAESQG